MPRKYALIILLAAIGGSILISLGCDKLVTETIETTIAGNPTADFTVTPDSGCVPLSVNFKDASSGPVRRWIWNFGDGAYDTLRATAGEIGDISHTYTQSGTFTVTLSVFDSLDGSDAEIKKRAVIAGHNIDSVHISDTIGCPGKEFTFTAHNPYGVASWSWFFGDGTISTDASPVQTHTYAEPGIYEFRLTASGACGTQTITDSVHILVCANPYFTVEPHETCARSPLKFLDATPPIVIDTVDGVPDTAVVVDWLWNFGNGTTQHYTQATDTIDFEYVSAGTYTVTLTVTTDEGGKSSYVDSVTVFQSTVAAFSAAPTMSCQVPGRQYAARFTDGSTGATSWLWDFGDGFTSDEQNPAHAFLAAGYYTVKLSVSGPCGDAAIEKTDFIEYADQLDTAIMQLSSTDVDTLTDVIATDISPAATVVHREWNFGDGSPVVTDSLAASHRYHQPDTVWVKLKRYNACDTLYDSTLVIISLP